MRVVANKAMVLGQLQRLDICRNPQGLRLWLAADIAGMQLLELLAGRHSSAGRPPSQMARS